MGYEPLGNTLSGVIVMAASIRIGGTTAGAGNVISATGIGGSESPSLGPVGRRHQLTLIGTDVTGRMPWATATPAS